MVQFCSDAPGKNNTREITFSYNTNNENDQEILNKIRKIISKEQPLCENCCNFYYEVCLGGYKKACACLIHGMLESFNNPHYDQDGSKCKDYCQKTE